MKRYLLWPIIFLFLATFAHGGGSQQTSTRLASAIIDNVEIILQDSSNVTWTAAQHLQNLNDGMMDIVSRTSCMEGTESITLVDEQVEYSITSDYITVKGVKFVDKDSKEKGLSKGNVWSVGNVDKVDEPVYWYAWNDKIGAYPAWNPNETVCSFTSFTEVDPNTRIAVAATELTFTALTKNEDAYVYEKVDEPYFDDTFEVQFDFTITSMDADGAIFLLTLATAVNDFTGLETASEQALGISVTSDAGTLKPYIVETVNGTTTSTHCSTVTAFTATATYYATLKRNNMESGQRNISIAFYTDSTRKTLHGSEYLYVPSTNETYQYIFALQTDNTGDSEATTGYSRNHSYAFNVDGFTGACTLTAYYVENPDIIASGAAISTPHIYDKALVLYMLAQAFYQDGQVQRYMQTMGLYYAELDRFRADLNESAVKPSEVIVK